MIASRAFSAKKAWIPVRRSYPLCHSGERPLGITRKTYIKLAIVGTSRTGEGYGILGELQLSSNEYSWFVHFLS